METENKFFVGKVKSTGLYQFVRVPKEANLEVEAEVIIIPKKYFEIIGTTSGLVLEKSAYDAMKAIFERKNEVKP